MKKKNNNFIKSIHYECIDFFENDIKKINEQIENSIKILTYNIPKQIQIKKYNLKNLIIELIENILFNSEFENQNYSDYIIPFNMDIYIYNYNLILKSLINLLNLNFEKIKLLNLPIIELNHFNWNSIEYKNDFLKILSDLNLLNYNKMNNFFNDDEKKEFDDEKNIEKLFKNTLKYIKKYLLLLNKNKKNIIPIISNISTILHDFYDNKTNIIPFKQIFHLIIDFHFQNFLNFDNYLIYTDLEFDDINNYIFDNVHSLIKPFFDDFDQISDNDDDDDNDDADSIIFDEKIIGIISFNLKNY
jgi:hypothetical protein